MNHNDLGKLTAYEIIKTETLSDISSEGIMLRHKKTGARILVLSNEDTNKVFAVTFRTPPTDSTGTPHIIEHTVLCGSEKYPLKDPFVELIKGSLNTFLNAITFPDKTMYPVASTNDADFRNLMNVYLDAVFFPNIYHEKNIFRQEGWHYEITDPAEPLTLNGVVYNEMKGAFSSADEILEREIMHSMFPDTQYGVESGGDPEVIPDLTYEAYLDFHRRYYHPSNSYIYLYGNMDAADTLDFIDREYLSRFEAADVDSELRAQKPFGGERVTKKFYPIAAGDETEKKTYISISFAAGDPLNACEMLAMQILDYALLGVPGAPVKQALLDAGIGLDVYGGLSDGMLQPYFSIIAKDADEKDVDRFRAVIRETLEKQVRDGVDRKSVKAALSSSEFSYREADFGNYPKGLIYGMDVMETWLYDDDEPFAGLKLLGTFREMEKLAETDYFEKMIEEKFLGSDHSSVVILLPKPGLAEEREKKTEEKLAAIKAGMSAEEIDALVSETKALLAWQDSEETPEAIASLPVIKRSDIRAEVTERSNIEETITVRGDSGNETEVPAVLHDKETNGIAYLQLLFGTKAVPDDMIPYIGLLKECLSYVSTADHDYTDLTHEIGVRTGGILCTNSVLDDVNAPESYLSYFEIRMKALISKYEEGAQLIREILYTSDFTDAKRLREIVSKTRSQLETGLQAAGNAAASRRASAYTSSGSAYSDMISGISYYRFIRDLENAFDERKDETIEALKKVSSHLFAPANALVSVTCDRKEFENVRAAIAGCLDGDAKPEVIWTEEHDVRPFGVLNEGFTTSGQVQYVALAGSYAGSGVEYSGSMAVYRHLMNYEYLWQNVRVRGGAYGCGTAIKRSGMGAFASYRDPNLSRTIEVYEGAADFLKEFDADDDTMTKYVIGTFSGIDAPLTPATFGTVSLAEYLSGITREMRQKFRTEVLETSAEDIRALAAAVEAILKTRSLCVIGSESAIRKDAELFGKTEALL